MKETFLKMLSYVIANFLPSPTALAAHDVRDFECGTVVVLPGIPVFLSSEDALDSSERRRDELAEQFMDSRSWLSAVLETSLASGTATQRIEV